MPEQKEPKTSGIPYTPIHSLSCIFPALYSVLLEILVAPFIDVIAWLHFGQYPVLPACEVRYTDDNHKDRSGVPSCKSYSTPGKEILTCSSACHF